MNAAALVLLNGILPAEKERFAALASEGDRLRREAGLEFPSDNAAGKAIGEAVAALALARAGDDGSGKPWTGTIPTGPGRWLATRPPAVPGNATWRPWVLPSNDALRPPPPPAFDSPQVVAALAEVKNYGRTPQATEAAIYWHAYGNARNFQMWNSELSKRALEHGLSQQDTPRMAAAYAALAVAYHDSHVACWDAKYHYWDARPAMLDPRITPLFATPNHPSYPSAHGSLSSAASGVLGALFPSDAATFEALVNEISEARIAGGIHVRSDQTAGEAIGRAVAALILARSAPGT
jgi:hypothetical protein